MENSNEKTRLMVPRQKKTQSDGCNIKINYTVAGKLVSREFSKTFSLGRSADCEFVINDESISRRHAEIELTKTGWVIRDLASSNGTYVNGKRIVEVQLADKDTFHFDNKNSLFSVHIQDNSEATKLQTNIYQPKTHTRARSSIPLVEKKLSSKPEDNKDDVYDHYFSNKSDEEMGDHTRMVRNIIKQEQQKEQQKSSSRYKLIIASVAILLVFASALIFYQQVRLDRAQAIAVAMFYDIKTIEVQLAQTEIEAEKNQSQTQIASISLKRQKLKEMKARYQNYLDEIDFSRQFKASLSKEDEAIVQMAKIFGECDLELPKEFITEVKKYISKWQSSKRLTNAISRIDRLGHTEMVISAMHAAGLAPQFLYLSLQESNFRFDAIGPETRFGIAKGAWQFMPETGKEYGLKIGPLAPFSEHDPDDERFDFEKSSYAAAQYLKKIYSAEAQASGLLVMASYNWGHNRVRRIINKMPNNPRERNFWKLTQNYKIPKETYDYVFYIFSAAVIGDDPELFGFDFKNPILSALENAS